MSGPWQFVSDGTVVDIRACPGASDTLCAAIVGLPREPEVADPEVRGLLCGFRVMGDLRRSGAASERPAQWKGWVADPEEKLDGKEPEHHTATLTHVSENQARLDVLGPLGVLVETHWLLRVITPVTTGCR
ncbi:hypothetical protein OOT46_16610 [Aquabacterium sp. A7-Y]|uniref:hypothetical protein n=1 Tax=Aquabacterium sp. A7-Y TaxID=1349605 RepID=UPI00223D28F3|nr:hypothetical protein [Aquabacterium sp. A7-Y]MCW7539465.1 hypothetical protein [Aquabacterium sp. A7-Y]